MMNGGRGYPEPCKDDAGMPKKMTSKRLAARRSWALLLGSALGIGCVWSGAAQEGGQAAPRKPPSGAQLISGDARYLSADYAPCMLSAGANAAHERRCADQEFLVQDRALDTAYTQARAAMAEDDRLVLLKLQREWQQFVATRCAQDAKADAAVALDALQCRIHATLYRTRQLQGQGAASLVAAEKAGSPGQPAPAVSASAQPNAQGWIVLEPGKGTSDATLTVSLRVSACNERNGLVSCALRDMRLERNGKRVPVSGMQDRVTYATPRSRGNAFNQPPVTVSDFNRDGHPDLQVWVSNAGNYGDSVFAFYLFDAIKGRYVRNVALEKAVGGRSILQITGSRFVLSSKSGPCENQDKVIEMEGAVPVTRFYRAYDTCKGEVPTDLQLLE